MSMQLQIKGSHLSATKCCKIVTQDNKKDKKGKTYAFPFYLFHVCGFNQNLQSSPIPKTLFVRLNTSIPDKVVPL